MSKETPPGSSPSSPASGGLFGNAPYTGPEPDHDAKRTAVLAHLFGIFSFVGPLIVWMIKKEEGPFVDDQGKEALNFQITVLIVSVTIAVLGLVVCFFRILTPV